MGYEVYQAANGRDALDILSGDDRRNAGGCPDARDGWTVLEQLHQRHAHIPVVVMSADDHGTTAPKPENMERKVIFLQVQATCYRMFRELPAYSRLHHCST